MTRAEADRLPFVSPDGLWAIVPRAGRPRWLTAVEACAFAAMCSTLVFATVAVGAPQGLPRVAIGVGVVLAGGGAVGLWRQFVRRRIGAGAERRRDAELAEAGARGERAASLLERAHRAAVAAGAARRGQWKLEYEAWRDASARTDVAPVRVLFLAPNLAPAKGFEALRDLREPEDISQHLSRFRARPVWTNILLLVIGGAFVVTALNRGNPLGGILWGFLGVSAVLGLLGRFGVRPIERTSAFVAPARIALSTPRSAGEWTARESVLVVDRDNGDFVAALHAADLREPVCFYFPGPDDESWKRFLATWLWGAEPARPIFED